MACAYRKRSVWYARYKAASGGWRSEATKVATKAAALRLAQDMEHSGRLDQGTQP